MQTELELRVRSLDADLKKAIEETKSVSSQLEAARKASATPSPVALDSSEHTSKISQLESR